MENRKRLRHFIRGEIRVIDFEDGFGTVDGMETWELDGICIPLSILSEDTLQPAEKLLAGYILGIACGTGVCYDAQKDSYYIYLNIQARVAKQAGKHLVLSLGLNKRLRNLADLGYLSMLDDSYIVGKSVKKIYLNNLDKWGIN